MNTATGNSRSKRQARAISMPFSWMTTPRPTPIHAASVSPQVCTALRPSTTTRPSSGVMAIGRVRHSPARSSTSCTSEPSRPAGTFDGAIERVQYLYNLGITHVEIMPVAEFAGDRGWGYDGVDLFAVTQHYGGPDAMKRFVDACHLHGDRRHPRRRLQPLRPGRQLHRQVRSLHDGETQHPLGCRHQL